MNNIIKFSLSVTGFILIALSISGCVAQQSKMIGSPRVTHQFETQKMLDDHEYYYSGRKEKPIAVVGIHKDYSLVGNHWHHIVFTKKSLKRTIEMMVFHDDAKYKIDPNGAVITGPDGRQVGVWYSIWKFSRVKVYNNHTVEILKPVPIFPPRMHKPRFD